MFFRDDRRTVAEREAEERRQKDLEIEKKRLADERRMQSQKVKRRDRSFVFCLFFDVFRSSKKRFEKIKSKKKKLMTEFFVISIRMMKMPMPRTTRGNYAN